MRALTWQGRQQVEVREVPDPRIEEPDDAIVRVTSTSICGSDDERDPLGTERFASHHVPLGEAPIAYERFQKKQDGTFKVVLQP